MTEEEREKFEMVEAVQDEIYCREKKIVDMGNRKVTDVRINKRIMLPDPRPAGEEAVLMVRRERLLQVANEYILEKCDKKGNIKDSNFTEEERRGVRKLNKRISNKEIIVRPTDKSHKLRVCTWDN